jgi:hypothetical protein
MAVAKTEETAGKVSGEQKKSSIEMTYTIAAKDNLKVIESSCGRVGHERDG